MKILKGVNKMDHPDIRNAEMWGYPKAFEHKHIMTDAFKNEIYTGDEYLEFDGEVYRIESLSSDAVEVLEIHGAERKTA